MIRFENSDSLDPTNSPLAVSAWVNCESPNGVILAHGGPALGYALVVNDGKPKFLVRTSNEQLDSVSGPNRIVGSWAHLVGVLKRDQLQLYVDGQLVASGKSSGFISANPAQSLQIGGDDGGSVGDYRSPSAFMGAIDEVRIHHGTILDDEITQLVSPAAKPKDAQLVLSCSFDARNAKDESGMQNHGKVDSIRTTEGRFGIAMRFRGASTSRAANSFVQHHWKRDVPLLVRAMLKADETLFIAGPPDLIDEEETFERIMARDPQVQKKLSTQDKALDGAQGGLLMAVSTKDGSTLSQLKMSSLPVWDGLAAADGRLFASTMDGQVVCFAP